MPKETSPLPQAPAGWGIEWRRFCAGCVLLAGMGSEAGFRIGWNVGGLVVVEEIGWNVGGLMMVGV